MRIKYDVSYPTWIKDRIELYVDVNELVNLCLEVAKEDDYFNIYDADDILDFIYEYVGSEIYQKEFRSQLTSPNDYDNCDDTIDETEGLDELVDAIQQELKRRGYYEN